MRNVRGRVAFADERLQHRPDETHADVGHPGGGDLSGHEMKLRTGGDPGGQDAKADFQRGEMAAALREFPRLPRRDNINQAHGRGEFEVLPVVEAEPIMEEEVEVVEINHHREGVDALDGVAGGAEFSRSGHHLEIS